MLPNIFLLKRILLIGLLAAGAAVEDFCADEEAKERAERDRLNWEVFQSLMKAKQQAQIAESASATANSLLLGFSVPVPGNIPGTGKEVIATPAVGGTAQTVMVVTNNGSTSLIVQNGKGNQTSSFAVPNGFGNLSGDPIGWYVGGTVGTVYQGVSLYSGASVANVNLASAPPPPGHAKPHAINPTPVPAGTAFMPDSSGVYVTDKSAALFYFVNIASQTAAAYTNAVSPAGSGKPAVLPNGAQVWIPNPAANSITVYDTLTNTLVTTITGITSPTEVAFTADGTRAAVISNASTGQAGFIVSVDALQYVVLGQVQVGINPHTLSLNPYGTDFWTANTGSGTISDVEISGAKPTVLATDPVGTSPAGVAAINTFAR